MQLISVTAIVYLAANGALEPSSVNARSFMPALVPTIVAIIVVKAREKFSWFKAS